jgi:hypothetical protein
VLGVVEHEQELARLQPAGDRLGGLFAGGLRDRQRAGDGGGHEGGVAQRRELDEAGAVGVRVCELSGELEREPGLAGAAGAAEGEQADVVAQQQLAQLVELVFTAERAVRWRRQRERRRLGCRRCCEGGVVLQDLALQLAQLHARLEPELVAEAVAERGVEIERLGLPAAAVEGEHRERAWPLPQRLLRREALHFRERRAVTAELELGLEPFLVAGEAELLEPFGLGAGEFLVGELAVGAAAPERERSPQQRRS